MMTGRLPVVADAPADLKAVHLGQHHVQDHGVEAAAGQHLQRRAGPRGLQHLQAVALEEGRQRRPQSFVVVDQQQAAHGLDCGRWRCLTPSLSRRGDGVT
jgi:hypothetical protein